MSRPRVIGPPARTTPPSWRWFAAWLLVGAAVAFGLLGALTIGVFVLPVALVAAAGLARFGDPGSGLPGVIAGLGVAPLFVAYLNRDGPGTICTTTARSVACGDQWSPWPWLAAGLVLVSAGIVWFILGRRPTGPVRAAAAAAVKDAGARPGELGDVAGDL